MRHTLHLVSITAAFTFAAWMASGAALARPAVAKATATVLATYPHGAQLAAGHGVLAVAAHTADDRAATLLVGSGTDAPVPAPGAGTLPRWAIPHVGTDTHGAPVVTYPRCGSSAVASCDLYAWNVDTHVEQRVAAAARGGVGEIEGAFDGGALVFSRWTGKGKPVTFIDHQQVFAPTTLFYRPAHGSVRRLAAPGGEQLALRGRWIAQVRDTTTPENDGLCGVSTVELVSVSGKTVRPMRTTGCGLNGQSSAGPSFIGGGLMFALVENDAGDGIVLRRGLAATARAQQARTPDVLIGFAPSSPTAGYALVERYPADADDPVYDLQRVTGLASAAA
ncbi:MAG: hypothetical protein REI11_13185 [Patulibacter sp.]|nr:hypothetical protein [Patulibacter sp.]